VLLHRLFQRKRPWAIQHILHIFGNKKASDSTEEALLEFLSKKPGSERAHAVEKEFLKDLRV
jgi:hypothetical protein